MIYKKILEKNTDFCFNFAVLSLGVSIYDKTLYGFIIAFTAYCLGTFLAFLNA